MFSIDTESDRNATQVKFTQAGNTVIVRLNSIQPTNQYAASQKAIVEVNVNGEPSGDQKAARYHQYWLAEYFSKFASIQQYPGVVFKFWVFILNSNASIKSAMANALTACCLASGITMDRTLLALNYQGGVLFSQKASEQALWVVLDIHSYLPVQVVGGSNWSAGQSSWPDVCREFGNTLKRWLEREYLY